MLSLPPQAPHHATVCALSPPDTAWNVSLSAWGLQLRLRLTSRVPASFSAALCQRRGGRCEPEAPVYTVTRSSAPGELALLLPVQVLGSCVLVWRSDVRFARKQLLCPDGKRTLGLGSWASSSACYGGESRPCTGWLRLGEAAGQLLSCRGAQHSPDGLLTPGLGCVEWNKSAVYISLCRFLRYFGAAGPVCSP
uniref:Uncharacterized protein n=1 Tax=Pavo cristatus TaxID=9049 RepID=A0A8C9G920_PAVCR